MRSSDVDQAFIERALNLFSDNKVAGTKSRRTMVALGNRGLSPLFAAVYHFEPEATVILS